jgi:cation diffusion facilitator CzcD-associated flavoprotein CzcO
MENSNKMAPEQDCAVTGSAAAVEHAGKAPPGGGPRVCVIGAGSSGLVALKSLREVGVDAVGLEMGGDLGGLWKFQNSNGRSGAYRSLCINTSTEAMQFSDYPMPTNIGKFPHHRHIAAYFESYARNFELRPHIRFHQEVESCVPLGPEGRDGYCVTTHDREQGTRQAEHFDGVIVANGHHWSPAYPSPNPAARFGGFMCHSHDYIDPMTPYDFRGQRVVVVGLGNSAVDIACELARTSPQARVSLSCRRGAWVLPKFLLGKPIDQGTLIPRIFPSKWQRIIATKGFVKLRGRMSDYGLPEPDHLIGEAHPTVSSDLPELVERGDIDVYPQISDCSESRIRFTDGRQVEADAIVFCTGYDVRLPFLTSEHVAVKDNVLPLYLRAFHPERRRLFFVGLMQTVGAVMPSAELQAKIIAAHIAGNYNLPDPPAMNQAIEKHENEMRRRFVPSRRHTMQVIVEDFIPQVQRELRAGQRRAARGLGVAFASGGGERSAP